MGQVTYFLMFGLGLVMIIKGSDWFIDAVIWAASVFKIPYIIIGATIVSLCTSMPETFVGLTASLKGETDVAFGNAIGSIALNTGIIMAIIIIFARPILEDRLQFIWNGSFLVGVITFTWVAGMILGEITRILGAILILLLVYYIASNFLQAKKIMGINSEMAAEDVFHVDTTKKTIIKNSFFFLLGITMVIIGSNLLVDNGISIAEFLGVPSMVIAITFTALGTSLPELVTAIASIRKKVTNLGVGNIIGANILNMVEVIGLSALVTPIPMDKDPSILAFQFPLVLIIVSCAVLFGVFSINGFKRWQGVIIFLLYLVFLAFNLFRENTPFLGPIIF